MQNLLKSWMQKSAYHEIRNVKLSFSFHNSFAILDQTDFVLGLTVFELLKDEAFLADSRFDLQNMLRRSFKVTFLYLVVRDCISDGPRAWNAAVNGNQVSADDFLHFQAAFHCCANLKLFNIF